jgi:Domain of unknown function (DUF4259)
MGAWDIGPFDNDDAADFLAGLSGTPAAGRAGRLRAALALPGGYLQIDDASAAVAAAALLAAASGMALAGHGEAGELVQSGRSRAMARSGRWPVRRWPAWRAKTASGPNFGQTAAHWPGQPPSLTASGSTFSRPRLVRGR